MFKYGVLKKNPLKSIIHFRIKKKSCKKEIRSLLHSCKIPQKKKATIKSHLCEMQTKYEICMLIVWLLMLNDYILMTTRLIVILKCS